ncbi:MAG: type 1 glutamine amidotransferase, partial [bacterium]
EMSRPLSDPDNHLPDASGFDLLIIMGGPMGVYDETKHPWLVDEKAFIRRYIAQRKPVLGICLGAQLLAEALGAKVFPGDHREIGWFDIHTDPAVLTGDFSGAIPPIFSAFHWHGDTFDLPAGATSLGFSDATRHQGFWANGRHLGLQFHLETTLASAEALIQHCADDLQPGPYVQSAEDILQTPAFDSINQTMAKLLDRFIDLADENRPG